MSAPPAQTGTYPLLGSLRERCRAKVLKRLHDRVENEARWLTYSMKCSGGQFGEYPARHASEPGGCANTGVTCLCECHDKGGGNGAH